MNLKVKMNLINQNKKYLHEQILNLNIFFNNFCC